MAAGGSQIPSPGGPWKWQGRSQAGPGPDVNVPAPGQEADAGLTLRGAGSRVIASQEVPETSGNELLAPSTVCSFRRAGREEAQRSSPDVRSQGVCSASGGEAGHMIIPQVNLSKCALNFACAVCVHQKCS